MARLLHVPLSLILCGAVPAGLKAGPIHDAIGKASPDVLEFLISKGADIEAKDKLDWKPLGVSANGGHAATAAALLLHGADADSHNDAGKTPLFETAFSVHFGVVKILIEADADVHARSKLQKDTAFITELLLAKGAGIFASAGFSSPLDHAGFFGKDSGKPILRKFEKHRLHYRLVHFSSDNEPAITPRLTKAEGVFVIHGTRGKSYAIEYHTGEKEWQPHETVTLYSNKQLYIDPESATGTRIYRARMAD